MSAIVKALEVVLVGLLAICLAFVLGLLLAFPIMILWNWLMPEIFGLRAISFWQAYGLSILSTLLLKSQSSSSSKS